MQMLETADRLEGGVGRARTEEIQIAQRLQAGELAHAGVADRILLEPQMSQVDHSGQGSETAVIEPGSAQIQSQYLGCDPPEQLQLLVRDRRRTRVIDIE